MASPFGVDRYIQRALPAASRMNRALMPAASGMVSRQDTLGEVKEPGGSSDGTAVAAVACSEGSARLATASVAISLRRIFPPDQRAGVTRREDVSARME